MYDGKYARKRDKPPPVPEQNATPHEIGEMQVLTNEQIAQATGLSAEEIAQL